MVQRNLIPHLAYCHLVVVGFHQELVEAVPPQVLQNCQGVYPGLRKVLLQQSLLVVLEVVAAAEACQLYLVVALYWRSSQKPAETALARARDQCAHL